MDFAQGVEKCNRNHYEKLVLLTAQQRDERLNQSAAMYGWHKWRIKPSIYLAVWRLLDLSPPRCGIWKEHCGSQCICASPEAYLIVECIV